MNHSELPSVCIWLHGLGDKGSSWYDAFRYYSVKTPNNCSLFFPNAPIIPVTCNGGAKTTAWFDIKKYLLMKMNQMMKLDFLDLSHLSILLLIIILIKVLTQTVSLLVVLAKVELLHYYLDYNININ